MTEQNSVSAKRLLPLVVVLIIAASAVVAYLLTIQSTEKQRLEADMIRGLGFGDTTVLTLSEEYTDADNDLVADPPADAEARVSPETFYFSYVPASDEERQQVAWSEFLEQLGEALGKPVEQKAFGKRDDQLEALRNGELHITCFNTGAVPVAVCTAGFVPICVPGNGDGEFGYQMKVIVPAGSDIEKLEDLRGKKITFTRRTSNSGCMAALVLLADKYNMQPERDYQWGFSLSHEGSINDIASGNLEAAPVAGDLLDRAIGENPELKDKIRVIHESERFPPAALGYCHNLATEDAEKIREFCLAFDFEGTGLVESFAGSGATKFVPINYKDDWGIVREINDSLAKNGEN